MLLQHGADPSRRDKDISFGLISVVVGRLPRDNCTGRSLCPGRSICGWLQRGLMTVGTKLMSQSGKRQDVVMALLAHGIDVNATAGSPWDALTSSSDRLAHENG